MTTAPSTTLVKVHRLADGAVLYKYDDGSWLIDMPGFGLHELVGVEDVTGIEAPA